MTDNVDRGAPDWRLVADGPEPVGLSFEAVDGPDDPLFDPYTLPADAD